MTALDPRLRLEQAIKGLLARSRQALRPVGKCACWCSARPNPNASAVCPHYSLSSESYLSDHVLFTLQIGPKYVRELEGVASRFVYEQLQQPPPAPDVDGPSEGTALPPTAIVAILVSASTFTKASIMRALSSPIPFILLHLPHATAPHVSSSNLGEEPGEVEAAQTEVLVGSAIVNPALSGTKAEDVLGLTGELEVRWEINGKTRRRRKGDDHPEVREPGRLGLWWRGKRVENWVPRTA